MEVGREPGSGRGEFGVVPSLWCHAKCPIRQFAKRNWPIGSYWENNNLLGNQNLVVMK